MEDNIIYKKIYHISDIHIRNTEEHKVGYLHVFENLYNYLSQVKSDDALIVLTGDILHNKEKLTATSEMLCVDFFKNLSKLMTTIVIPGNHDYNEKNDSIVDSLSSLIYKRNFKNLHYLKLSGVYKFNNISFGVSSLLDGKFTKSSEIIDDSLKIGLYHGPISNSMNSKGFEFANTSITQFDGYDLVLLGDIHFHQYLNDIKTVAYASSLISQNFSETDLYHGVLVWNLEDKTSKYKIIDNDYRYEEILLDNMKIYQHNKIVKMEDIKLPKYGKLRINTTDNDNIFYNKVISDIKKKYTEITIVHNKLMLSKITNNLDNKKTDTTDELSIKTIIANELKTIDPTIKDNIKNILDNELKDAIQNQDDKFDFKLLSLEFSNMFSYGENNSINFQKLTHDEITGLFAGNSMGKSSLIDIILFALFDDYSRNYQDKHKLLSGTIINSATKYFSCTIKFFSCNMIYTIYKKGQRLLAKTDHTHDTFKFLEYDFYKTINDKKISLNGQDRFETLKNIINIIGTYDDFCLTSLCLQNNFRNNIDFLTMSSIDRKQFLSNRIKFDIFKTVEMKYKDLLKETTFKLKELEKSDDIILYDYNSESIIKQITDDNIVIEENINSLQSKIDKNNNMLTKEIKNILPIIDKYKKCSIDELESELQLSSKLMKILPKQNYGDESYVHNLYQDNMNLTKNLKPVNIKENYNQINDRKKEINIILSNYKLDIMTNLRRVEQLKNDLAQINPKLRHLSKNNKPISNYIIDNIKAIIDSIIIKDNNYSELKLELTCKLIELENDQKLLLNNMEYFEATDDIIQEYNNINDYDKYVSDKSFELKDYDLVYNSKMVSDANKDLIKLFNDFNSCINNNCSNCIKHSENIKEYYSKILHCNNLTSDIDNQFMILTNTKIKLENIKKYHKLRNIETVKQSRDLLISYYKNELINITKENEYNIMLKEYKDELIHQYELAKQNNILYEINYIETFIELSNELKEININEDNIKYNDKIQLKIDENNIKINKYNTNKKLYLEYTNNINNITTSINNTNINSAIHTKINNIKDKISECMRELIQLKNTLLTNTNKLESINKQICKYNLCNTKIKTFKKDIIIYDIIFKLVGQKGIPRKIINIKLEYIEKEVNSIIVPFLNKRVFITKEIDDIKVFITDINGRKLGPSGGMEAFLVSLGFKIAFTKVFNIKQCSLLIIDEGVSVLDKDHVSKFSIIGDFIKKYYNNIILITHIDSFYDYVIDRINIVKKNKMSLVNYK